MIEFYKKRGETPLEALARLRQEMPEFANETLSYAGRLDPMAEGVLPVLVGEENKNRQEFLGKDKEYRATFILGISTDTGDVLGKIQKVFMRDIEEEKIKQTFSNFIKIKMQTYPWYSSKTVKGIPLFEYARKKMFEIVRPQREVSIYSVENIFIERFLFKDIQKTIREDIQKVKGDFRQDEIIEKWSNLNDLGQIQCVTCTLKVSSGTYIRSLTENIEEVLGCPAVLYALIRTRVF